MLLFPYLQTGTISFNPNRSLGRYGVYTKSVVRAIWVYPSRCSISFCFKMQRMVLPSGV